MIVNDAMLFRSARPFCRQTLTSKKSDFGATSLPKSPTSIFFPRGPKKKLRTKKPWVSELTLSPQN